MILIKNKAETGFYFMVISKLNGETNIYKSELVFSEDPHEYLHSYVKDYLEKEEEHITVLWRLENDDDWTTFYDCRPFAIDNLQNLTPAKWKQLLYLMNNKDKKVVRKELYPCSRERFLERYVEMHPEFLNTVKCILL